VVVRSDTSLPRLARILEQTMGWDGYHLHMFDVAGVLFGVAGEDADYLINEKAAKVRHVLPRVGSSLRWDYDFGDSWEHDVVTESIESPDDDKRYPACLGGAMACPPEDCGGVTGYDQLRSVLADPTHRDHRRLSEWAPEGFDPTAFDVAEANRRLRGR
jgi:hypothetical protein